MFEYEVNASQVREAEIVVGIASYREADAIAFPVRQADLGLTEFFGDRRSVIVNCDNHSPDGTEGAFLGTETRVPKIYITTPPDTPGKGYNFENLFRKAHQLGARVIVCVDADLRSITPEWIRDFAEPVLDGHDYVTPVYARHKYDGTITNNICYPLVYGLLGTDLRQPIGGDFALSASFADHVLLQPWHRTTEQYGIDIFLSLTAILGGFAVAQTGLGAKVHKPSAPKLGPMFVQVVGTAFLTILDHLPRWKDREHVQATERFGKASLEKAQELEVDRDAVKARAVDGYRRNRTPMASYLRDETFREVRAMFEEDRIAIGEDLWVRIVYEMMASFRAAADRNAVIESLRPLYFARTWTFMNDTWAMSTPEAEKLIVRQAEAFRERRSYLLEMLSGR